MTTQLILGLLPNAAYLATQHLLSGIETSTTFKLTPQAGPASVFKSLMLRSQALLTVTFEDSHNTSNASFGGQLQRALPDLLIKNPQVAVCALTPAVGTPVVAARNDARSTFARDLDITPFFSAFGPAHQALGCQREPAITTVGVAAVRDLRLQEAFNLIGEMAKLGFAPLLHTNAYLDQKLFAQAGVAASKADPFMPLIFRTGVETAHDLAATEKALAALIDATPSAQAAYLCHQAPQTLRLVRKTAAPKAS